MLVLRVELSRLSACVSDPVLMRLLHNAVRDRAQQFGGGVLVMSSGDVIAMLPVAASGAAEAIAADVVAVALGEAHDEAIEAELGADPLVMTWRLPEHYTELRELAGVYLAGKDEERSRQPAYEDLRGSLSHAHIPALNRILGAADLSAHQRRRRVWRNTGDRWIAAFDRHSVDQGAVCSDLLPQLSLPRRGRILLDVRKAFDSWNLKRLVQDPPAAGQVMALGLSAESTSSQGFHDMVKRLDADQRSRTIVEMEADDLYSDLAVGQAALGILRRAGFRTAITSVRLAFLASYNLTALGTDLVAIRLDRESLPHLQQPVIVAALRALPHDRVVLTGCDHDGAVSIAGMFGFSLLDGPAIDRMAR